MAAKKAAKKAAKTKGPRGEQRCSLCLQGGHNARTCGVKK